MAPDQGIPGWFVAFFALAIVVGVGSFLWRLSVARRIAESAGLDPKTATAVTMLSKDGVDAAYLAAALASRTQPAAPQPAPAPKTTEQRLQELQALKDKALITQAEYDARRADILGSI